MLREILDLFFIKSDSNNVLCVYDFRFPCNFFTSKNGEKIVASNFDLTICF